MHYIYCALYQLLLHQLHLRSSGIRSWRSGTRALKYSLLSTSKGEPDQLTLAGNQTPITEGRYLRCGGVKEKHFLWDFLGNQTPLRDGKYHKGNTAYIALVMLSPSKGDKISPYTACLSETIIKKSF